MEILFVVYLHECLLPVILRGTWIWPGSGNFSLGGKVHVHALDLMAVGRCAGSAACISSGLSWRYNTAICGSLQDRNCSAKGWTDATGCLTSAHIVLDIWQVFSFSSFSSLPTPTKMVSQDDLEKQELVVFYEDGDQGGHVKALNIPADRIQRKTITNRGGASCFRVKLKLDTCVRGQMDEASKTPATFDPIRSAVRSGW